MPARIQVVGFRQKVDTTNATVINTCFGGKPSHPAAWQLDLSPFVIGPCPLYGKHTALNMENGWQFTKLYAVHADKSGNPTQTFWDWMDKGIKNPKAIRFPMGRGKKPLHAWWDGRKLGYIDARKEIYAPLYAEAVQKTAGWTQLQGLYQSQTHLIFRDFDGYDHDKKGQDLTHVLNNPKRKMGHSFVLKMLLTDDPALKQILLRQ